jgi:hypothetical protein
LGWWNSQLNGTKNMFQTTSQKTIVENESPNRKWNMAMQNPHMEMWKWKISHKLTTFRCHVWLPEGKTTLNPLNSTWNLKMVAPRCRKNSSRTDVWSSCRPRLCYFFWDQNWHIFHQSTLGLFHNWNLGQVSAGWWLEILVTNSGGTLWEFKSLGTGLDGPRSSMI